MKLAVLLLVIACGAKPPPPPAPPPVANHEAPPKPPAPVSLDLDSQDVLARTDEAKEAHVKHVLVAWRDLADAYGGRLDERAANRSQEDAARLATSIAQRLRANLGSIDALAAEYSEDPGGRDAPYVVRADTPFVPEFKALALRLHENEVGIVKTRFGYHVILRVPTPPPDPLESADILARAPEAGPVLVEYILISWQGRRGKQVTRSKADADTLAKEVLAKVTAGGDMDALIKQYSDDPSPQDHARAIEITADMPMTDSVKDLSLRLHVGEAGLVSTDAGWALIKRVPPPPPDPLESAAIMKREQLTDHAKVKHILLGWTEVHADDERGKKRDRKALEKLVKATVAKLQKGAKIEPLMKELSEDPGSAESGMSYDVTPDAGLVPPFKQLSLRLKVKEVGVVKTVFGIHIIQRVE